jgi:hypothetical protein
MSAPLRRNSATLDDSIAGWPTAEGDEDMPHFSLNQ